MKLFSWTNIQLILMLSLVTFLYSFAEKRNNSRKLTKTTVVFIGENAPFIRQETVNKLLIENSKDVKTINKDNLDLNKLEKKLNKHEMIEKSDVFVSADGVLKAIVKQKTPIARFDDINKSFYVDYNGDRMPFSENYTARVPLVSGELNENNSKKIAELLRIIFDDEFLKKNIIALQIMPNGSLKMWNRNYNYDIDFGGTVRMQAKFNNYKAFFQKAILDSCLQKYKKIDLRFSQQVICTK